jgi:hypothetical protein
VEWCKVDQPDTVAIRLSQRRAQLDGKASFADATAPGQRHQALGIQQLAKLD